jgi:hypothetical protein
MIHACRTQGFSTRPVWVAEVKDRKSAGSLSEALSNVFARSEVPSPARTVKPWT